VVAVPRGRGSVTSREGVGAVSLKPVGALTVCYYDIKCA
jgi:hypothetical protein